MGLGLADAATSFIAGLAYAATNNDTAPPLDNTTASPLDNNTALPLAAFKFSIVAGERHGEVSGLYSYGLYSYGTARSAAAAADVDPVLAITV